MATNNHLLDQHWSFAQRKAKSDQQEFQPIDKIPTSIHVELLKSGKIPDPYKGMAEWDVQWIGEAEWVFKTTFTPTSAELSSPHLDLVLDGLDTFAEVFLNGTSILKTTNMFISNRVDVKKVVKKGENELRIEFDSAWARGKQEEKENGGKRPLWNGDSSRLYVRKAGYHYEWDWGPRLMTVGPWKPIYLQSYTSRISDVQINSTVSEALDVSVDITIQTEGEKPEALLVVLKDSKGTVVRSAEASTEDRKVSWKFKKGEVELWYPINYGKQTQYHVEVNLIGSKTSSPLDTRVSKVGFRRSLLVQEPLEGQSGTSFLFEVNNIRIFAGGSNWIPADNFLTEISDERYRAWLDLLVKGNQNMVRVWGGGIFEPDVFYDTCDELGILVWQDFLFGCGLYPAYDAYVASVKVEAEQAVARLRDHPSLVVWAANNEDYAIAEEQKLKFDDDPEDLQSTDFPARHLYERVLPEVVHRLSPNVAYRRGSPYGGTTTSDKKTGDTHMWDMWHGKQEPWSKLAEMSSRFIAEFGMEGAPNIRTIDYWLDGRKDQRFPQSKVNDQHNKADGFERRIACYLIENFKMNTYEMEDYVFYTQIMQAEALSSAYRLWRREWRGRGKEYTSGALVWQLNDCWPTTSWAIVDYFLRPKPAYFAMKKELATYTVGIVRKEITTFADEITSANREIKDQIEIWGTNSSLEPKKATLEIRVFDLHGKQLDVQTQAITLDPNSSTELYKASIPSQPVRTLQSQEADAVVVGARILDVNNEVLARFDDWPNPYKYIVYPSPYNPVTLTTLPASQSADHVESVSITATLPVKGIVLEVAAEKEGEKEVKWSNQAFDLLPGDQVVVQAPNLNGREVIVRFVGDRS